jgi:hypothetical protein
LMGGSTRSRPEPEKRHTKQREPADSAQEAPEAAGANVASATGRVDPSFVRRYSELFGLELSADEIPSLVSHLDDLVERIARLSKIEVSPMVEDADAGVAQTEHRRG